MFNSEQLNSIYKQFLIINKTENSIFDSKSENKK